MKFLSLIVIVGAFIFCSSLNPLLGKEGISKNNVEMDNTAEQTTITCDGPLDVDFPNNIAVFHDNVVIENQRGRVKADLMKVFFNETDRSVSLVEATGNVIINIDNKVARSNKAEYKVPEGILELTGDPRIQEDKNVYAAEKITIFQKNGQTEMKLEPKAKLLLYWEETDNSGLFF
ncbi:hypothetical protein KDK77_06640 [bacterium]|nr:hypothetical protein [bacterium]MCP5462601.1 hypothetical protein [bacterium]